MGFSSGKGSQPFQFNNSSSTLDNFYDKIKDFAVFFFLNQQILRANTVHIQHIHEKTNKQENISKSLYLPKSKIL